MGEVYKGLTIRIGADMTELNRALRSSNSAINETQKQLRLLQKAARLDSADIGVAARQMEVMGDKAQALNAQLRIMKSSNFMRQLGEDTEDAALKAKLADSEYNKVCATIAELKTEVVNAAQAAGRTEESFEQAFKGMQEGSKQAIAKMRELGASEEQVAQYAALVERYWESLSNKKLTKQISDVAEFKTKLAATEAEMRAVYTQVTRLATANPTVTMTAGFERFKREMQSADATATELRGELNKLDNALKLDPSSVEAARLKMANMQDQVRLNITQLKELKAQMAELKSGGHSRVFEELAEDGRSFWQELSRAENEVTELRMSLDKAKAALHELTYDTSVDRTTDDFRRLEAEVDQLTADLKQAEAYQDRLANAKVYASLHSQYTLLSADTSKLIADMKTANSQASILRGTLQQLGWALYSTATPMASMFAHAAINAAEEVDAAYRDMRKTVQGTEEQFEELKDAAMEFSMTHVTSADQILEIEAMGGQLGIATENLAAFAETVSNLEIATNLDADTAAEQLGQLSSILNDMTEDDFASFGDALVRLGNNNATLEDKIMNVMLRIASMGTITGFTTTELLAWSTAVAATGQGAEAAGTAISNTMSDIETAVGKGGDALAGFASVAQMSSEDFANAWNTDPSSALYAFIQGLKDIEANGGSADATLQDLGITGVRQKQTITGLMQTIEGLNDNLKMSEDAWNGVSDEWGAAGDAAREAERKAEGFSGAVQRIRNVGQNLGVEVGESIAPAIVALGDALEALATGYKNLPDVAKWTIDGIAGIAVAAGPTLVAYNALSGAHRDLMASLASRGTAWAGAVKGNTVMVNGLQAQYEKLTMVNEKGEKVALTYDQMNKKQRLTATSLGVLNGVMGALAVTAVISTFSLLVELWTDATTKAKNLETSTNGLKSALTHTSSAASTASDDVSDYASAAAEAAKSVWELAESGAALAQTIRDRHEALETDLTLFGEYTSVFDELAGKTNLTDEEFAKLVIAIDELNARCGTSYEVVKDSAEGYKIMADGAEVAKDKIYELIAAQEAQMRFNVAQQDYEDLLKRQGDASEALAAKQRELNEELAWNAEFVAAGGQLTEEQIQHMQDLQAEVEQLKGQYNEAGEAVDFASEQMTLFTEIIKGTADDYQKLVGSNDLLMDHINLSGGSLMTFCDQLEQTGIDTEKLAALSEDQLALLGEAYDGTIESIIIAMSKMAGEVGDYGKQSIENWKSGFESGTQDAIDAARKMSGLTLAELYELAHEYGISGDEAINKFATAIANGTDPVIAATKTVVTSTETELADFDTASIGEDFTAGFARGIGRKASQAATAAANMVYSALAAAKEAQRSASPAKELIPVGGNFTEGYALGIEKEAYLAELEATRMVEQAVKAAQQTIDANGLTMQAKVAGEFASGVGRAGGQVVTQTTTTNSNNRHNINVYIEAHDLEDLATVEEFVQLLERSN